MMQLRRVVQGLVKRIVLLLLAGIVIIFVAHLESGTRPINLAGLKAERWFADDWLGHTMAYLQGLVRGELGTVLPMKQSGFSVEQPVGQLLLTYGPGSLLLLVSALLVSLLGGTLFGLLASRFGARWVRAPALWSAMLVISTPDILIVILLHTLVVRVMSAYGIKLFAVTSLGGSLTASHFVAPLLALSALPLGVVARLAAVAFDEVYDQLYIRTAVAKGLPTWRVILRHALKNAWIRVVEAWPLILSSLISGLVIVEYVLRFPGLGRTIGLSLELGGQSEALASIALVLLLLAVLLDLLMGAIRLALDPRLAEAARVRQAEAHWIAGTGMALSLPAPGEFWTELRSVLSDWRSRLGQWLWRNRPSRILTLIGRNRILMLGLLGVGLLLFTAFFGAQFVELSDRRMVVRFLVEDGEIAFPPYKPGTDSFPLGSDMAGRSVWTRLLIGARYTLFFTLAVTPVRFLLALPWGLVAGLRRGFWATAASTLGLLLSALPVVLIPAMVIQVYRVWFANPTTGVGFWVITAILALVGIPRLAETVRQHVEAISVQPFVEGARAVGASNGRILWRHIFPHLAPHLWVAAAADMAWTLLLLAQFGVFSIYLGGSTFVSTGYEVMAQASSGVQVPRIADWSSMLSKPYDLIYQAPWALWYSALAFLFAIISFNLVAEGLRRWSQHMTASVPVEEEAAASSPGRRRMVLEWGSVAIALMLGLNLTFRYAFESQELYRSAQAQPTLERARLQLEAILQLAESGGLLQERANFLVREVGEQYLFHAYKASMSPEEIRRQSQGRVEVHQFDRFLVGIIVVGDDKAVPSTSHLFVLDVNSAGVAYAQPAIRPTSVAVIPQDQHDRWLLLAGETPDGQSPAVSVWAGPTRSFRYPVRYSWRIAPPAAERLLEIAPFPFRAEGNLNGHRVVAWDQVREVRLDSNGDLSICPEDDGTCATLRWLETGGWAPPSS